MKVKSLSCVRLLATPWTAAYQAPPSMGFSRQEYWSGVPLPSPSSCPREGHKCETEEANQRSTCWETKMRGSNREDWMRRKKRSRNYKDTFCLLIKILCFEDTAANRKKENHSGDGSSEGQRLHSRMSLISHHLWVQATVPQVTV